MKLPLTEQGDYAFVHWQQKEYVTCTDQGIGFTGHRAGRNTLKVYWHYDLGDKCVTLVHNGNDNNVERIDHDFKPDINWITQCSKAMTAWEKSK